MWRYSVYDFLRGLYYVFESHVAPTYEVRTDRPYVFTLQSISVPLPDDNELRYIGTSPVPYMVVCSDDQMERAQILIGLRPAPDGFDDGTFATGIIAVGVVMGLIGLVKTVL